MNNESMYNTFVRDRSNGNKGNPGARRPQASVTKKSIPDIEFDADDVLEDLEESGDVKREPVGVDSSLSGFPDYIGHGEVKQPEEKPKSILEELEEVYTGPDFSENTYTDPFEFKGGSVSLPQPEIFNSYPPEVQRKIMEWTDRDLKARRDDESRRQDAVLRANIARDRNKTTIPVVITVLLIVCALISGMYTKKPIFSIAFLIVALVVIIALVVMKSQNEKRHKNTSSYPGR